MDILNIIDRMESLVSTSARVPATGRTLVDVAKLAELIDQARLAVPQDVKAAHEILLRKDSVLGQAQIEARRLKTSADEEFKTRLNESELVKAARRRADDMIQEAQRKAQRLLEQADTEAKTRRAESDAYALETLRNLEVQLGSLLSTVRRGMDVMQ